MQFCIFIKIIKKMESRERAILLVKYQKEYIYIFLEYIYILHLYIVFIYFYIIIIHWKSVS